jgi:hypothetical protein
VLMVCSFSWASLERTLRAGRAPVMTRSDLLFSAAGAVKLARDGQT